MIIFTAPCMSFRIYLSLDETRQFSYFYNRHTPPLYPVPDKCTTVIYDTEIFTTATHHHSIRNQTNAQLSDIILAFLQPPSPPLYALLDKYTIISYKTDIFATDQTTTVTRQMCNYQLRYWHFYNRHTPPLYLVPDKCATFRYHTF